MDELGVRRFLDTGYPRIVAMVTLVCGSQPAAEDAVHARFAWEGVREDGEVQALLSQRGEPIERQVWRKDDAAPHRDRSSTCRHIGIVAERRQNTLAHEGYRRPSVENEARAEIPARPYQTNGNNDLASGRIER